MNKRRLHLFLGSLLFLCSAGPAAGQTEPPKTSVPELKCGDQFPIKGKAQGMTYSLYEYSFRRNMVTHTVTPEYPLEAQEAGIQGQVKLHVLFDAEGHLLKARVSDSPHRLLSEAVLEALKGWRVKNRMPGVGPVRSPVLAELRFVFTLKDGRAEVTDAPEEEQRKKNEGLAKEVCR
ncbi:MAG TPA: energy transducer TonB [Pyrinomonadaceae bacterium]|nr:energy transducer TonB [Pyrinomonadaceae bacterium]